MKNYIFVRNKRYRPSSYYRVCQYMDESSKYIIEYEPDVFYKVNKSNKILKKFYDIVLQFIPGYINRIIKILNIIVGNKKSEYNIYIQRAVFPKFLGPIAKLLFKIMINRSNKVFWDFDDNIIESKEVTKIERYILEKNSDVIIVGNEFLKSRLSIEHQKKVKLIPTTDKSMENVNLDELNKKRLKDYKDKIIIIWVGTSSNLQFLKGICPYIDRAAFNLSNFYQKKLVLNVVCDKNLEYKFENAVLNNTKWNRNIAMQSMKSAHIGIMPLEQNYYTPGKCGFKAIQTIGLGIPTIVSPVGFNKEVIADGYNGYIAYTGDEWIDYIIKLSIDQNNWESISQNCIKVWRQKFNSKDVEAYLYSLMGVSCKSRW